MEDKEQGGMSFEEETIQDEEIIESAEPSESLEPREVPESADEAAEPAWEEPEQDDALSEITAEEQPSEAIREPARGTFYADPFFNVPPILGELEGLDRETFWNSVSAVKVKRKRRRPSVSLIILSVLMLLFMTAVLLTVINGRGWLIKLINGGKNIEFTLPVEDRPKLAETAYQEDGRYTVEGVSEAVMPSIVALEIYTSNSAFLPTSQGSGIIMSTDGYILTNAHVVDGAAKIKVVLYNKEEYAAELIGTDPATDIAVIKISKKGLTPAQFGNSDEVKLGEDIVVMGSPAGFYNSVSKGIVSGLNRMIKVESYSVPMSCIQVDAAINPGNSGGALINMWGQVIGITSSKLASRTYYGIGFAISVNAAKPVIERLMEYGYVEDRARIGITFYQISEETAMMYGTKAGLYIAAIDTKCDIANTEIAEGDIITKLDGKFVSTSSEVKDMLENYRPGDTMTAEVFRPDEDDPSQGVEFTISFKLEVDDSSLIEKSS